MSIELVMPSNHIVLCCLLFLLPSIPASGSFLSQLFTSGGQSIGASASVLPMNIHGSFPLRLTGLIFTVSKGLSGVSSSTTVQRHQFSGALPSLWSSSHNHTWLLGRPLPDYISTFIGGVMSLLFNILSRFIIAFLSGGNHLIISWLQSPSAMILEPKKRKSVLFLIHDTSIQTCTVHLALWYLF